MIVMIQFYPIFPYHQVFKSMDPWGENHPISDLTHETHRVIAGHCSWGSTASHLGTQNTLKIMHGHCVTASGIENRNIAKENEAKRPLKTSHGIPTFWALQRIAMPFKGWHSLSMRMSTFEYVRACSSQETYWCSPECGKIRWEGPPLWGDLPWQIQVNISMPQWSTVQGITCRDRYR